MSKCAATRAEVEDYVSQLEGPLRSLHASTGVRFHLVIANCDVPAGLSAVSIHNFDREPLIRALSEVLEHEWKRT